MTLKWDVRGDWSGTYWLRVGIIDEEGFLIPFSGEEGRTVYHQEIGSIDTSWNLGRPWVIQNSVPVERQYNQRRNATTGTTERQFLVIQDEAKLELGADSPILYGIYDSDGGYPLRRRIPAPFSGTGKAGLSSGTGKAAVKRSTACANMGSTRQFTKGGRLSGKPLRQNFRCLPKWRDARQN
ncbi:MAG: hypothetical protein ACLR23_00320 [Clostridia bacterium]